MSESSAERETAPPEEEAVSEEEAGSEEQAGSGAEAGSGAAAPTDEVVTSGAADSGSGAPGESETADEAERSGSEQNSTDHARADQTGADQTGADRGGTSEQHSEPDDPEPGRSKLGQPESGRPESGQPESGQPEQDLPETLTFRITRTTLLAVISFTVCATPVASAQPWLLWVYLFPLAALVWVLRVRTTVSAEGVRVRTLTGTTHVSWDDVQSVKLDSRRWVEAVLTSGERVKLPAVRVRDLSRLSAMSRGRIPDPAR